MMRVSSYCIFAFFSFNNDGSSSHGVCITGLFAYNFCLASSDVSFTFVTLRMYNK